MLRSFSRRNCSWLLITELKHDHKYKVKLTVVLVRRAGFRGGGVGPQAARQQGASHQFNSS